jgi:hypothetical protein
MRFDLFDVLATVGLVLIGAAVWLAWGGAAALAYAGIVLVIVGVTGASVSQKPRAQAGE